MHALQRRQLVDRHDVLLRGADTACVLTVGNGEFAFNADITGLQTFSERWAAPLATLAQWAWHSEPNPLGHRLDDAMQPWQLHGRTVQFASAGWPSTTPDAANTAAQWLERNPHKFNLARIGLRLLHVDGSAASLDDLVGPQQALRLWTATLHSSFDFDGLALDVTTRVHPRLDVVAVSIRCPAHATDRIGIDLRLRGGGAAEADSAGGAVDAVGGQPASVEHVELLHAEQHHVAWRRRIDDTAVHVTLRSLQPLRCVPTGAGWALHAADASGAIDVTIGFSTQPWAGGLPSVAETEAAALAHWDAHWSRGGIVDFAGSADPRAHELERRVVLSQYLMAVHAAGSLPPQETGLAEISWHGKFHVEMHPWHAAHFALWGRPELLERSMGWYEQHLPVARERARSQGLAGARWPKMTGPDGRESPGAINPFIVWQQPHPIHLAELLFRAGPATQTATLQRHAQMVFDSADCIAALAVRGAADGRFHIGPPVVPVQEIHAPGTTIDPAFELAYFRFGLRTAQRWRERLGLPRSAHWDAVADGLAPLPQHGGLYVVAASQPDLWQRADCDECRQRGEPLALDDLLHNRCPNVDHPAFAAALGFLPGDGFVDVETMRRTLHKVRDAWNLDKVWGWDFGMLAMTAARLGEPALAVDFLLHPSVANRWGRDGRVGWKFINAYLPANGALLAAVALMAAGWDSAVPLAANPGFPADGSWQVRAEGLLASP